MLTKARNLRILDIDTECLPGHWIGGDYVSKIITAVAWKWIGERRPTIVQTHYDLSSEEMAVNIADAIMEADIVVGHYIRGFDLPLINGNLLRAKMPSLNTVFSQDTKLDLVKSHGRSLSQRNLAALLGVKAPKVDVTLEDWERFNTRTPGYRDKGIERVVGDVKQNIEMRAALIELGWLGAPSYWRPKATGGNGGYRG